MQPNYAFKPTSRNSFLLGLTYMTFSKLRCFALALVGTMGVPLVHAYDPADRGFACRASISSDILVGKVLHTSDGVCEFDSKCATVRVLSSAKGSQSSEIRVLFAGPISELNPVCCEEGATYLFYLTKIEGSDLYESSDGVYGVYRLDQQFK